MSIITQAIKRWWTSDPATHCAALAYYAIFAIAPMFIIFVTVFGRIFGEQAVEGKLMKAIQGFAGNNASHLIQALVTYFTSPFNSVIATTISILFIIVGALALFSQVQISLDHIWRSQEHHREAKPFLKTNILAVGMVVILGIFLAISFFISAAWPFIARMALKPSLAHVGVVVNFIDAINTGVSFAYVMILFALMYKYLPGKPVSWKAAFAGGIVGGILFFIGRFLLGLYITTTVISSIYGAAGAVVLMLIWFYYSAELFFFGGALAYAVDQNDEMSHPL